MGTVTIVIVSRRFTIDKNAASRLVYRAIVMIEVDARIHDPCCFSGAIAIADLVYIPGNEAGRYHSEAGADGDHPVLFYHRYSRVAFERQCFLGRKFHNVMQLLAGSFTNDLV